MREVRTLWFREWPWWEVPFFTLPFVGDVSFRRLAYMLAFAVLGWFAGSYVVQGYGGVGGAAAGLVAGFLLGAPYRLLPPEAMLLHVLSSPPAAPKRTKEGKARQAPVTVSVSDVEEPVKVFGTVRDARGRPVANAEVTLFVDGRPEARVSTDWDGRFVFYTQLSPGVHEVVVKHGDVPVLRSVVRVEVRRG